MSLPDPVEAQVLRFVADRLEGITGSSYFYTPDHVWIVDEPELPMLDDGWELAYFVYPGDGIFSPETGLRVDAHVDFYIMGALQNRTGADSPAEVPEGEEGPIRKLRLFSDVRRAVMGAQAPGFAQQLWISDRNLRVYAPGWHLVQIQGSAQFSEVFA